MRRAVLLTGHYWGSKRQAGFHWITRSLLKMGWEVLFFTAPISLLSVLRRDHRLKYIRLNELNRLIQKDNNLRSIVRFTLIHPVDLRSPLLNKLSYKLFSRYENISLMDSKSFIKKAELIVFESNPVLFLFKQIKEICPDARMVYRVSDDLRLLDCHPALINMEQKLLPSFDLISVPSKYIYNVLGARPNMKLQTHGINKELYDDEKNNPYYTSDSTNLVFVGQKYFDYDFLDIASGLFPNYHFHIIGPLKQSVRKDNIQYYGEIPFEETVGYIKYPDIGLHTLIHRHGAESFTDSLKVIQYEYCRLPIVAPDYMDCHRPQIFYYKPGNPESINEAISRAIKYDRSKISTDQVNTWDNVTGLLIGEKVEQKRVDSRQ
jgi:2-beta-glucuronyltransferase